jgi:hypothetical protein
MTELAVYDSTPNTPTIAQQQAHMQTQAVQRLADWAASAQAAYSVAEKLCETSFCPQGYRGKPAEATAAMLAGAEVGLSPLASLRSFDPIQGVSAPRAITLRAIVQSQGHEIILEESTETRCRMRGKRRGSTEWTKVTWTMDRAKNLGLTNKDNWKKQPQAMLVARATSEVCRLVAADAILGIGYTVEELTDEPGTTGTPGTAETQPTTRKMSRRQPIIDNPPQKTGPLGLHPQEPEPITDAQITKLHASFGDIGITDRDQKLAYASKVLDHPIDSSRDLTKAEAMRVIDALDADITAAVPSLNEPEEPA